MVVLTIQAKQSKEPRQRSQDQPTPDLASPEWEIGHACPPHVNTAKECRNTHTSKNHLRRFRVFLPHNNSRKSTNEPGKDACHVPLAAKTAQWHPWSSQSLGPAGSETRLCCCAMSISRRCARISRKYLVLPEDRLRHCRCVETLQVRYQLEKVPCLVSRENSKVSIVTHGQLPN